MSEQVEDFKKLVNYGDILSSVRGIYGKDAHIIDYKIERATKLVQGFTSLVLRITTNIKIGKKERTVNFVAKVLPTLKEQLEIGAEMDLFGREIFYFNKILPLISQDGEIDIPIVKCYFANESTIIMEDLCVSNYNTYYEDVSRMLHEQLEYSHVRIAIRKLAKIHAATIGFDWPSIIDEKYQKNDPLDSVMFQGMIQNGCKMISATIKELICEDNNTDKYQKYIEWLEDKDTAFNILVNGIKPVKDGLNVLCHGDCWANNMMFQSTKDKKHALDMKFIDLQIYRYTSPTRDLLYFLYMCFSHKFRKQHEDILLKTYVEAFNTYVKRTPDILSFDELKSTYNSSRMFGIIMALFSRPMQALLNDQPQGESVTSEQFEQLFQTDYSVVAKQTLHTNDLFRNVCLEIAHEFIDVVDDLNLI